MTKPSSNQSSLQWVDGTAFVYNDPGYYQTWYQDEPDAVNNQPCIEMYRDTGKWSDIECDQMQWAICEMLCTYAVSLS